MTDALTPVTGSKNEHDGWDKHGRATSERNARLRDAAGRAVCVFQALRGSDPRARGAMCLTAVAAALVLPVGGATAAAAPDGRTHTPAPRPPSAALVDGCRSTIGPPPRQVVRMALSRGESATSTASVDETGGVSVSTRVVSRLARPLTVEVRLVLADVAGRPIFWAYRDYRLAPASAMRLPVGRPRVQADVMRFRLSQQEHEALAWIALCQRPLQEAIR